MTFWGALVRYLVKCLSIWICLTFFSWLEWDYWVKEYDHFWHLRHICHILLSKYCAAAAKSPGSAIPGILQARTLEWVAISYSNAWKWKVKVKSLSCVRPSANPWTAAFQAPPSMGFSRKEYWTGVPLPSPLVLTRVYQKTFAPWKKSYDKPKVAQSCPTLCNPMDCSLPGISSMGFFRQEFWSGVPFPSPEDLPDPGIEPRSPAL